MIINKEYNNLLANNSDSRNILIGFWASKLNGDFKYNLSKPPIKLPWPEDFVDDSWSEIEKQQVISYLNYSGKTKTAYDGWSECRFCKKHVGGTDLTDGLYIWPEGFLHYIKEHNVKPSQQFIDHILSNGKIKTFQETIQEKLSKIFKK